jgi:DNA-binding NtrC family response regulator
MSKILVADRDLSRAQFIRRILVRRDICKSEGIVLMCDGLQVREALLANSYKLVIIGEELDGINAFDCIRFLLEKNTKHNYLFIVDDPRIEITREAFLLGIQGLYEIPIWIDGFVAMVFSMLSNRSVDFGAKIYELCAKRRY